nr:hypothetical protein [uncultured bacterium]
MLQNVASTHAWGKAELKEVRAIPTFVRHHHHIGVESKRKTTSRGVTLDRSDNRTLAAQQAFIHKGRIDKGPILGSQCFKCCGCATHAEDLIGAGQHYDLYLRHGGDLGERLLEQAEQVFGEHVVVSTVPHGEKRDSRIRDL